MSESGLHMFLFLPQGYEGKKLTSSFIAVKQAFIKDSIAEKTERISGHGVVFTTKMNSVEVRGILNMKDMPFLLIELTGNITAETIAGFLPDTDIEELKNLNTLNLKKSANWLRGELNKAVEFEDFERAAEIRDKLNNKE